MLTKRDRVLAEIRDTEKSFKKDMQELDKRLKAILAVKSIGFEDRQILESFSFAIAGILKANFLQNFLQNRTTDIDAINESLKSSFEKGQDFYNNCTDAVKFQSLMIETMTRLINSNRRVKALLENQKQEDLKQLDLQSYLIKPVQRICKYPLLLKDLIKNTPENQSTSLNRALNIIETQTDKLNEMKRSYDDDQRYAQVDSLVAQSHRSIVKLVSELKNIKPSAESRNALIDDILRIAFDPKIGTVEKLSRIKAEMHQRNFKNQVPEQLQKDFENVYSKLLKGVFAKQVLDSKNLEEKIITFEKEIKRLESERQQENERKKTQDDKKDYQGYQPQIDKFEEMINRLKQEEKSRFEGLKLNNKDGLILQNMIAQKLTDYTRTLQILKQKVKPLPARPVMQQSTVLMAQRLAQPPRLKDSPITSRRPPPSKSSPGVTPSKEKPVPPPRLSEQNMLKKSQVGTAPSKEKPLPPRPGPKK